MKFLFNILSLVPKICYHNVIIKKFNLVTFIYYTFSCFFLILSYEFMDLLYLSDFYKLIFSYLSQYLNFNIFGISNIRLIFKEIVQYCNSKDTLLVKYNNNNNLDKQDTLIYSKENSEDLFSNKSHSSNNQGNVNLIKESINGNTMFKFKRKLVWIFIEKNKNNFASYEDFIWSGYDPDLKFFKELTREFNSKIHNESYKWRLRKKVIMWFFNR